LRIPENNPSISDNDVLRPSALLALSLIDLLTYLLTYLFIFRLVCWLSEQATITMQLIHEYRQGLLQDDDNENMANIKKIAGQ
jgi:hypothetical protein